MRRRTLARWLVVGALAGFGLFGGAAVAAADTEATATNESASAEGSSGDAQSTNAAGQASAGPKAQQQEEAPAIVHHGDNRARVSQRSDNRSGDTVAGGQVVGSSGDGDTSMSLSNTSANSRATSGDAQSANVVGGVNAGPSAQGSGACPADGCLVHRGDNIADVSQNSRNASGDTVAGGQVVGAASNGNIALDATNTSVDSLARSGDAQAINLIGEVSAGAHLAFVDANGDFPDEGILTVDGLAPLGAGGGSAAQFPDFGLDGFLPNGGFGLFAPVNALVAHRGNNEVRADQRMDNRSGDTVAGSQVFGLATSQSGNIAVRARNVSSDATATSGDAEAVNLLLQANSGPFYRGLIIVDPPVEGENFIWHRGDNTVNANQRLTNRTGDPVAGSQVISASAAGDVAIDAENVSVDASATSGEAAAANLVCCLSAGPVAEGLRADASPYASELVAAQLFGEITADIVHRGDNAVEASQRLDNRTGDPVAGSQVFGVAADGTVAIDATNVSADARATSGNAEGINLLGSVSAGPVVEEIVEPVFFAEGLGAAQLFDDVTATIFQHGDNEAVARQALTQKSGDPVAGSQVFGVATGADGDVAISASNVSVDSRATSGDVQGVNLLLAAFSGPVVVEVTENDLFATQLSGSVTGTVVQHGHNLGEVDQVLDQESGAPVAGGQVSGIAAGGAVSVALSNVSVDDRSASGDVDSLNLVPIVWIGPIVAPAAFFEELFGAFETDFGPIV